MERRVGTSAQHNNLNAVAEAVELQSRLVQIEIPKHKSLLIWQSKGRKMLLRVTLRTI